MSDFKHSSPVIPQLNFENIPYRADLNSNSQRLESGSLNHHKPIQGYEPDQVLEDHDYVCPKAPNVAKSSL